MAVGEAKVLRGTRDQMDIRKDRLSEYPGVADERDVEKTPNCWEQLR